MATFTKFFPFVENLAEGKINLQADTLRILLTNVAPDQNNGEKADLTEITQQHGYSAPAVTVSSSSQSGGTYKLVLADVVITASGGSFGPFRWVVLYDDTSVNDLLIGFWDYGGQLTIDDLNNITIDFDASAGALTIA